MGLTTDSVLVLLGPFLALHAVMALPRPLRLWQFLSAGLIAAGGAAATMGLLGCTLAAGYLFRATTIAVLPAVTLTVTAIARRSNAGNRQARLVTAAAPMLEMNELGIEALEMELGEGEVRLGEILGAPLLPPGKVLQAKKAYDALPEGGALIVYEAIIDDDRRENAFGLLMSLNMLIEGLGFDFTGADCRGWMADAGFSESYVEHLVGPDSMVVGIK